MARQIHKSNITKSRTKSLQIPFFWQLMIAFALVILVAGGGVSLAGHVALNRLEEPFTRDGASAITTHPWAARLAGYYDRQSSWKGVDAMIAGYPCGPGWEPWDENWQTDYIVASVDGVVVAASEEKWLGRTLHRWDLDDAAPIVVNDRQVGFLFLSLDYLGATSLHEIHTPLTALRTNLELSPDDEFVQRAQAQVERLEMLAEGLLNLSRIEAGAQAASRAVGGQTQRFLDAAEHLATMGKAVEHLGWTESFDTNFSSELSKNA